MSPSPISAEQWVIVASRQPELRPVGISLSSGCYQATDADRQRYRALIRNRVDSLLADEARYVERRRRNEPFLHAKQWKQVKKEKDLTFYRRYQRGQSLHDLALEEELPEIQRAVERGYTSLICDGTVKGSIEDMLYGMTASSQDDLMTGFSYKDPPRDCVWLGTVESPTPADPFHTADLIWALPKLPPVFSQVDVCYLKATGQELDANGERYGYMVLHSVHIAQCPAFATHGISRCKMYFVCLFREPHPGLLKVTVRGIFDLSKKVRMLTGLVSASTTSFMVGLLNGVGIGQAKKLTLLARRNRRTLGDVANTPRQSVCYMCCKRASFLGRTLCLGTQLSICYVCGGTVCSNCTRGVKRRIFAGASRPCSSVECCPNCVQKAARTINVRPAEPEFLVVADYYLNQQASSECAEILHADDMKQTNTSAVMPTASTTTASVEEYKFEFEDDPFSIALAMPELRRSSEGDVSSIDMDTNEPDSSPEAEAGSFGSTITVWLGGQHRLSIDDDDFIPSATPARTYSDRLYANARLAEKVEQRFHELNIQVAHT